MAKSKLGLDLELQLAAYKSGGDVPEIEAEGKTLVDLIDEFSDRVIADTKAGAYTEQGLQMRRATHGAELMKAADRLDRMANTVEEKAASDFDALWAKLTRPPVDVLEFLTFDRIGGLLHREDPMIRGQIILTAARRGTRDDVILRAALSYPVPPLSLGGMAGGIQQQWQALIDDGTLRDVQAELKAQVGPFGTDEYFVKAMRTLAQFARTTVTLGSTVGTESPIETMARLGQLF